MENSPDLVNLTWEQKRLIRAAMALVAKEFASDPNDRSGKWAAAILAAKAERLWPLTKLQPRETPLGMFSKRGLIYCLQDGSLYHSYTGEKWELSKAGVDALAAYDWLKDRGFTEEVES